MAMVVCGDFEPEQLLEEIKKRLIPKEANGEIKRIYPEEPEEHVWPNDISDVGLNIKVAIAAVPPLILQPWCLLENPVVLNYCRIPI